MDDGGASSLAAAPSVARFRRDRAVVGGGALIAGARIVTCAHVINAALGRPVGEAGRPAEPVALDFPLQDVDPVAGEVVAWCPPGELGEGDLAVVRIDPAVAGGLAPMELSARDPAADEDLALFGFPQRRPTGVWKSGVRRVGPLVGAWQQLIGRGARDYKLQRGFSGCPVVDAAGSVVGIFAQAEEAAEVDAGAEIPVAVAARALAEAGAELEVAEPQAVAPAAPAAGEPAAAASAWNVPPLRNPNFAGRDEQLRALRDALAAERVVAVTGLAGTGKSQLAVQYAHLASDDYDVVWWVPSDQAATLVGGLAALAAPLGLPEAGLDDRPAVARAVKAWLAGNARWLLVFDNAPDPEAVREWLPDRGAGHVVLTSRYAPWGGVAHVLRLGPLADEDAAQVLASRSGQDDDAAALALAQRLGGLPLALEQAGAYMEATGTPVAEYVRLFDTRRGELLAYTPDPATEPVMATWDLAFEQLREHAPAAADLVTVSAFLAADDIPRTLFVGRDDLPDRLDALSDPLRFADALGALARYSLVTPTGESLRVHRLVQDVGRERLTKEERAEWAGLAITATAPAFPFRPDDLATWPPSERLLPHVLATCEHALAAGAAALEAGPLLNAAAMFLTKQADFAQAERVLRMGLEVTEATVGSEHPHVAASLINLGDVLREQGDFAGAERAFRRALAIDEAVYGPDHPEVAIDLNNLGKLLLERGDLDGAEAAFRRALAIDEAALRPDDPKLAVRVHNVGHVLVERGDLEAAEAELRRALAISEAAYGPDHPLVADDVNSLGGVLYDRGDVEGAEAAYRRALAIDEAAYGPEHPSVGTRLTNLGSALGARDAFDEAEAAHRRALAIFEATYGPGHSTVATCHNNIGAVLMARGDSAGAEAAYARALAIDEAFFGPEHPILAVRHNNIAGVQARRGDLAGARAGYQRALEISRAALGPDHPRTVSIQTNLDTVSRR